MEPLQNIDYRSEEVKEILGTPPAWMVRYGTVVVVLGLLLMGLVFYTIKFPDKITGDFVVNTTGNIIDIPMPSDGYLDDIFVPDSALVQKNANIAVVSNDFRYPDYLDFHSFLKTLSEVKQTDAHNFFDRPSIELAQFRPAYDNMILYLEKYQASIKTDHSLEREGRLRSQRNRYRKQLKELQTQYEDTKKILRKRLKNLQGLRKRLVRGYENVGDQIRNGTIDSMNIVQRLQKIEYDIQVKKDEIKQIEREVVKEDNNVKQEGNLSYWESFQSRLHELTNELQSWEKAHLIKAPVTGYIVRYSTTWNTNQFYRKDVPIMGIIPKASTKRREEGFYFAEVNIGLDGYGKVEIGQEVLLKFDSYPYRQFGVVKGVVAQKALFPRNNSYRVDVKIPEPILTSFGEELPADPQMYGTADILTQKRRFLERIFEQFLSIFKNR